MKTKGIFLLGAIALLFLSARREKASVYNMRYIEENMRLIPAISFNTGPSDEDFQIVNTNQSKTVSINSFYMFRFEITNGMYCYYLRELQKAKVDTAQYNKALPDTLVWRDKLAYNEPYVLYYFRHPAYADYPLVGVNYDQAVAFCDWLTITYNKWPERKYQDVKFELPSRNEWIGAAYGGLSNPTFPWEGYSMMNKENRWMANFRGIDQGSVYRKVVSETDVMGRTIERTYLVGSPSWNFNDNSLQGDYADITAPVKSYFPNGYGLYNMAGNVEEMVREKGITKGGSWRDTGYYLNNSTEENYTDSTATSSERGFRITMKVGKQ